MATVVDEDKYELSFGPFRLAVGERLLTKDGVPIDVGGRAFDMLIALVSSPNEVISKKDLIARVWPDAFVEEGSLRFHMASLRKVLGDGKDGARYITTVAGRGYCFVAPVDRSITQRANASAAPPPFPHANLPTQLGRTVGRDDDVARLSTRISQSRLVTIVGPGGVGKTTVALAVAHHVAEAFAGAVLFVDLSMIGDPRLASTAVASLLGLPAQSEDPTPALLQFLKNKRALLILDTCEHLIEAIAAMAATIAAAAPQVHVLATSREALRIEGEHVYRLDPLICPPDTAPTSATALQEFPATQLFVERAVASGGPLDISDAEAAIVSDICRKLDGLALAIELAARHAESYGLAQTAALLDARLTPLWQGLRTAPPRQKTLQATLDWSFELLTDLERTVLHRLAVFVGHFTLEAALDVVTSPTLDRSAVFEAIESLVEKSMVATHPIGAMMRYRLLDTTRAYAIELDADRNDWAELSGRHASYYRRWLEQTGNEWSSLSTGAERAPHFAALNNVRSALTWCFGGDGDPAIGIGLAAAAGPVFRAMGLLPECHRWSERAVNALDEATRGGAEEMQLQASLGLSLMFTQGNNEAAIAALERSLDIAQTRGDRLSAVRLLGPLHFYHLRSGQFRVSLRYARSCSEFAAALHEPGANALAHTLLGVSLCIRGDLAEARLEIEAALRSERPLASRHIYFGFDHQSWAEIALIMTLWLQGHTRQARAAIDNAFPHAEATQHPASFAIVVSSVATLLWMGDLDVAEGHAARLISRAESQSFAPYLHMGHAFLGELAIRRGDIDAGVEILRSRLEALHAAKYELFTVRFHIVLASALAAGGQFSEAMTLIDETALRIDANGNTSYLPELLRLKGSILATTPGANEAEAEACFMRSLDMSRTQGALAWEVRTAMDLASLWARRDRPVEARALLRPVFERFDEGFGTTDYDRAAALLASIEARLPRD